MPTSPSASRASRPRCGATWPKAYAPAISKFIANGMDVATPSVKTGFTKDIYLTLENGSNFSFQTSGLMGPTCFMRMMPALSMT